MPFLVLYVGEGDQFDVAKVRSIFEASPRVKEIYDNLEDSIFEFDYWNESKDYPVRVRVEPSARTISFSSIDETSMEAALFLQSEYDIPIHAVDEGYEFDLLLSDVSSVAELDKKIVDAYSDG